MRLKAKTERRGFTLIEVAIAIGILAILTIVLASLFMRTLDTYGQVATDTDVTKQARACLDGIAREVPESTNVLAVNPAEQVDPANPEKPVAVQDDALLLWSARTSETEQVSLSLPTNFVSDPADYTPKRRSIILYYLNRSPEGIMQLVRHQLYYFDDNLETTYTEPFSWASPAYSGTDMVIQDAAGAEIHINRTTGAVAGTPSFREPLVVMNRVTSFDIASSGSDVHGNPIPMRVRLTCQNADRYGRTATTRLKTDIEFRNKPAS